MRTSSRPAIIIQARQKEKFVAKCVQSALKQTVPCEIIISDQRSTDKTLQVIKDTVREFGQTHHNVRVLECPIDGPYGMRSCNEHVRWAWQQTSKDCDWIFQLSADDYSLPNRVKVCMEAVEEHKCSAVACTMFFETPGNETRQSISGFPRITGYVMPGEGMLKLAYGSIIYGYSREFLEKMDDGGANTADVYFGFLAALDKGLYVVADPQHVHMEHAGAEMQMGFQGKMRGASGDEALRLAELNHFQLLNLYYSCFVTATERHPEGIPEEARQAVLNTVLGQSKAWLDARNVLHQHGLAPGILAP